LRRLAPPVAFFAAMAFPAIAPIGGGRRDVRVPARRPHR
jgi:hypothetical protein